MKQHTTPHTRAFPMTEKERLESSCARKGNETPDEQAARRLLNIERAVNQMAGTIPPVRPCNKLKEPG